MEKRERRPNLFFDNPSSEPKSVFSDDQTTEKQPSQKTPGPTTKLGSFHQKVKELITKIDGHHEHNQENHQENHQEQNQEQHQGQHQEGHHVSSRHYKDPTQKRNKTKNTNVPKNAKPAPPISRKP